MWKIFSAAVVVAAFGPTQTLSGVDVLPLLRINELNENVLNGGSSIRDCLVVYESGRFHLERRVQRIPKPPAELSVFEAQLSSEQTEALKKILSADAIRRLPAFTPPAFPLSIQTYYSLYVTIRSNGTEQTVGYLVWPDKSRNGSPNDTPEQIQQDWRLTRANLEPLQTWVSDVESGNLKPTQADPYLCLSLL
jgi:hypothetical protein